ncbi:MAG TPA: hypothetical protein VGM64_12210 [Lacunisphaera sp.]|jgi:hypothetical protein
MNLVFLHGRPATGKLTIARKLVTLTGYQLHHNHIAVDEALQLYAFGTPGFIQRREQLWREFFIRTAKQLPPGVVFTFSAENTVPQSFIDWLFGEWSAIGIRLLSVELVASEAAIEARLGASQRKHFKKITELSLYRELRSRGAFNSPVIPRSDLQINTEKSSADEAAREIVAHFKLNERTE